MQVDLERNKAVVRRWYSELDKANIDAIDEILSANVVVHFPGESGPIDADNYRRINQKFFAAFSDFQTTVLDQMAEGDRVATRAMHTAMHIGDFEGTPATGKRITYEYIAIDRFENGKIVEHWVQYDETGLLRQLSSR